MRFAGVIFVLVFMCLPFSLNADSFLVKSKKLTVLGRLTESDAEGSGSAWFIQLNPVITVHGRQISSLEVKSSDNRKLTSLEDKFIEATGKLTVSGTETVPRTFFKLSSIREHKHARSVGLICRLSAACRRDQLQESN